MPAAKKFRSSSIAYSSHVVTVHYHYTDLLNEMCKNLSFIHLQYFVMSLYMYNLERVTVTLTGRLEFASWEFSMVCYSMSICRITQEHKVFI